MTVLYIILSVAVVYLILGWLGGCLIAFYWSHETKRSRLHWDRGMENVCRAFILLGPFEFIVGLVLGVYPLVRYYTRVVEKKEFHTIRQDDHPKSWFGGCLCTRR